MAFVRRNLLWIAFLAFCAAAIYFKGDEPLFYSEGPYAAGKYIAWAMFFGFLGYTFYCSSKKSFLKSVPHIWKEIWVRQISIDLYIGIVLSCAVIYFHEGSLLILLLWLGPILLFANLAVLLYVAMNYGSLVSHFKG